MDRGWRRAGCYSYKYDFEGSCCQPYTIRLDTQEYQISQSQKKVIKKFNKFLLGEIDMQGNKIEEEELKQAPMQQLEKQSDQIKKKIEAAQKEALRKFALEFSLVLTQFSLPQEDLENLVAHSIISKSRDKILKSTQTFCSNYLIKLFFKLKELKITSEMKSFIETARTLKREDINIEDNGYLTFINKEMDEVDSFNKKDQSMKPKIIKEEEKKKGKEENAHMADDKLNYTQYFKEFSPMTEEQKGRQFKHNYTVQITRAVANEECFKVYQMYQEKVHKETEKSIGQYERFLCRSPLFDPADKQERERNPKDANNDKNRVAKDEGVWPEYMGGYHMIHRIDGEIFAVGVIDITPQVLSSVYLFYNPKYEFLCPGIFTAVREIEYCLRIQEVFKPDFKYYYMGLYFQDCQKSVYKAAYKPSQVLCPYTCNYVYLTDEVKKQIEQNVMPLLCTEKPKIKELNITEQQVNTLVSNFKFCLADQKIMLKIDDLSRQYVKQIKQTVSELYINMGLDVVMSSIFIIV